MQFLHETYLFTYFVTYLLTYFLFTTFTTYLFSLETYLFIYLKSEPNKQRVNITLSLQLTEEYLSIKS